MTAKPIRLVREAREELSQAASRYGAIRPELRWEFLRAIDEAFERMVRTGRHMAVVPGSDPTLAIRRIYVRRFPFVVYFAERPTTFRVFAVGHARRRPNYWRSRVR